MTMRRRQFLKTMGGAAFSAGLYGAAGTAAAALESGEDARPFPFADDRVPMNAANLCPMPTAITNAVSRFASELDVDMSGPNRARIMAIKEEARTGIAGQLGVTADEIAIVRNTSEANNIVVQGIDLDAGDEVLLWDQNHPSNDVAWSVRAKRSGLTVRHLSVPVDAGSEDEVVDRITAEIGPRTRVVSFTHISNVTGFRVPAEKVCAAIRASHPDMHIHVDGAQTWGHVDANLAAMDCDSFSGSAHKWYMGPREVGILYVRSSRQEAIWPGVVSIPWGSDAEPSVAGARRFEALGQRDDASIAALAETVRFHDELGPKGVEARSLEVSDLLRDSLVDRDIPLVSSTNPLFRSSVIIIQAPRENRAQLLTNLLADGGIIGATVNGLRLSPHIYNTAEHVERAVDAVAGSRRLLA